MKMKNILLSLALLGMTPVFAADGGQADVRIAMDDERAPVVVQGLLERPGIEAANAIQARVARVVATEIQERLYSGWETLSRWCGYAGTCALYGTAGVGVGALGVYGIAQMPADRQVTSTLVVVGGGLGTSLGAYRVYCDRQAGIEAEEIRTNLRREQAANVRLAQEVVTAQERVQTVVDSHNTARRDLHEANERNRALAGEVGRLGEATAASFTALRQDMAVRDGQGLLVLLGLWGDQIANSRSQIGLQLATARQLQVQDGAVAEAEARLATLGRQRLTLDEVIAAHRNVEGAQNHRLRALLPEEEQQGGE